MFIPGSVLFGGETGDQRGSTVEERGNEVVNREGLSTPGKGCLWKSQRK